MGSNLLGQDYLNGLAVYRRDLVEEVGWLRSAFKGAEKLYDSPLRVTGVTTPDRILHVPGSPLPLSRGKESCSFGG